jgi:hypothetical protein
MPVEVSDIPATPAELEDYVAALFLAAGHFVEKNIEERNVLELDIVATDYSMDPPRVVLAEAKSGGWGFGELFKVVGWMQYLRIEEGALFATAVPADKDLLRMQDVFGPLGVKIVELGDCADAIGRFSEAKLPPITQPDEVGHWRWVHATERLLMRKLIGYKQSDPSQQGPAAVVEYHRLVNDGIFFRRSVSGRLAALYAAYQDHPKLALGCAQEMDGKAFDPNPFFTTSSRMTEAMREGKHSLIQASFYVEHRARLAILKSAVDLAGKAPKVVDKLVRPRARVSHWSPASAELLRRRPQVAHRAADVPPLPPAVADPPLVVGRLLAGGPRGPRVHVAVGAVGRSEGGDLRSSDGFRSLLPHRHVVAHRGGLDPVPVREDDAVAFHGARSVPPVERVRAGPIWRPSLRGLHS